MDVLDKPVAGFHSLTSGTVSFRSTRVSLVLAVSFTSAAALAGLVELLVDRIAVPAVGGALGASAAEVTALLAAAGRVGVAAGAVLVLLALVGWSMASRNPAFTVAALVLVVSTVGAVVWPVPLLVVLTQALLAVAAAAFLAQRLWHPVRYKLAMWSIGLGIVAGQWSLSGLDGRSTLIPRAVAEAAFVVGVVLIATAVSSASHGGWVSIAGMVAGAGVALVSLASQFTPFVALLATGAMMWLPSLAYVAAAGATGYLIATWMREPATRVNAAGLVLLAVAGIEPTLVHHGATALLALVALGATARPEVLRWQ